MKNRNMKKLFASLGCLAAFALWTAAVRLLDVQAIGPCGSAVGLASLNHFVHNLTGVHMTLYTVTDWLGLVPFGFMLGFAVLGLVQWIKRRRLLAVDRSILLLGVFYIAVTAAYLFFEDVVINYRPVLIQGFLEASYPSSTTLLVLTVIPTTVMQLNCRIRSAVLQKGIVFLLTAFCVFMVLGRFLSGVHWLSDIIGGGMLSAGLVMLYDFFRNGKL